MRTKVLILGLICLFVFAYCNSPADPEIEKVLNPGNSGAKVEMIGTPGWYPGVWNACGGRTADVPLFGSMGRTDHRGEYYGVLRNTGTKTAHGVRLTIRMYASSNTAGGVFLGQITVPSSDGCCIFYHWEYGDPHDSTVYYSHYMLAPDEEIKWLALLPQEGNDWYEEVYWQGTEFIIEWN